MQKIQWVFFCILLHYACPYFQYKMYLRLPKKGRIIFFFDFKYIVFYIQILIKVSDIKFHENLSDTFHVNIYGKITLTHQQHEANMCFLPHCEHQWKLIRAASIFVYPSLLQRPLRTTNILLFWSVLPHTTANLRAWIFIGRKKYFNSCCWDEKSIFTFNIRDPLDTFCCKPNS
jgi:hypothetical protein